MSCFCRKAACQYGRGRGKCGQSSPKSKEKSGGRVYPKTPPQLAKICRNVERPGQAACDENESQSTKPNGHVEITSQSNGQPESYCRLWGALYRCDESDDAKQTSPGQCDRSKTDGRYPGG